MEGTREQADVIVSGRYLLPTWRHAERIEDGAVAVLRDEIIAVGGRAELTARFAEAEELHEPAGLIMPGLINTHTHAAMSLLRGLSDDLPLMTWLHDHIWPAEGRWVSEEFVTDGTRLAVAEMLRGGITCFNDMYFFPDVTGRVAATAGMRAVLGLILIDFPSAWADGPDEYLHRGLEVHDQFRNDSLISTAFAPHAPYSVSDAPLERVRVLADELEIPIHMHVHETRDEIMQGLSRHGTRPLAHLLKLGLVSPALAAVHMTQLEDDEISAFAETGASVVHCPESNLKLASGFCPVSRLLAAGINIALGTDSAASNNDLDMFGEMRTASLVAKAVGKSAAGMPALDSLRAATLNGAIALGIEGRTGSIETG